LRIRANRNRFFRVEIRERTAFVEQFQELQPKSIHAIKPIASLGRGHYDASALTSTAGGFPPAPILPADLACPVSSLPFFALTHRFPDVIDLTSES
jgi:hypothetical protein